MRTTLPDAYETTRTDLHRLAVYVVSPARAAADGQITLRSTPGGFGTPVFGPDDRQVRVDSVDLVVEEGGETVAREPVTTLARAAELVGIAPAVEQEGQFDVPPHGDLDAQLAVDPEAAAALADWYLLAFEALGELWRESRAEDRASPHVRLWPEHFDAAVDLGAEDRGGTYGLSPGDRFDPHPYVYATRWGGGADDPFYNAPFGGAWLPYAEVAGAPDPRAAVLAFLREARGKRLGY
jgi:hypothetical protein